MTVREITTYGRRNRWVMAVVVMALLALAIPSGISLASSSGDMPLGVFSTSCDVNLGASSRVTGLTYSSSKLNVSASVEVNGTARSQGKLDIGASARLKGPVHSNSDLTIGASSQHNHDSQATYVGTLHQGANTPTWNPLKVSAQPALTSPLSFNIGDYAPGGSKAEAAGAHYHYHPYGLKVGASKTLATGLHYVKGNVTLGAGARGTATIVATGTITVGGKAKLTPYIDNLGLASDAGKGKCNSVITIGASAKVGTLFAPNGGIGVGASAIVDGAAVGRRVTIGANAKVLGAEVWQGELDCGDSTGVRRDGGVTAEITRHENADEEPCEPKLFRLIPDETDEHQGSVVFEVFDPSGQPHAFFEAKLTFEPDVTEPFVKLEYDPDATDGYDDFKVMPYCVEDPFVGEGGTPNPDAIPGDHQGCVLSVNQNYRDSTPTNWHVVFMGDWKFR